MKATLAALKAIDPYMWEDLSVDLKCASYTAISDGLVDVSDKIIVALEDWDEAHAVAKVHYSGHEFGYRGKVITDAGETYLEPTIDQVKAVIDELIERLETTNA